MKKIKLSGIELQRIGYHSDFSKSLAKTIIAKYYNGKTKKAILEILTDVIQNPDQYKKHNYFSELVESITPSSTAINKTIKLRTSPIPYIIYGKQNIEEGSLKQMDTAMKLPVSVQGALMADAHQGYGLPIGGVLATDNAVIPYGVGMDIGCRMCMSVYSLPCSLIEKDQNKLKQILLSETRFGKDEFDQKIDHEIMERKEFTDIKFLRSLKTKAYKQLGTSGHGNHFVDIGVLNLKDNQNEWNLPIGEYFAILSHSGSRGMGAEIARYYTRIAKDICNLPKGFRELSWLDLNSEEGQEYWMAMNLAGDYSRANHEQIHLRLSNALGEKTLFKVENHHNFAWKEKLVDGKDVIVHRKGATPASKGTLGIIPGSMASPAFIVRGKGNPESINSAAHGAGRLLSRKVAKQSITKREMQQYLNNNSVTLLGGNTDEAPWVYKDIHQVMEYQKDLVEIITLFTPRIVRMAK